MKDEVRYSKGCLYSGVRLFFLMIIIGLFSCGREEVNLVGESPFIVGKIVLIDDSTCRYVRNDIIGGRFADVFSSKQAIVAQRGLFSVGDTIIFTKNK